MVTNGERRGQIIEEFEIKIDALIYIYIYIYIRAYYIAQGAILNISQ